jgi:replicative DNA helicase
MLKFTNSHEEQILLGSLIMQNELLQKVSDILKPEHFYFDSNQKIYDEILKKVNMEKTAADFITLRPFFQTLPEGLKYLSSLMGYASSIIPIRDYAFNLAELATKRRLSVGFIELASNLETSSSEEIVLKIKDLIASIDSDSSEIEIFDGEGLEQSLMDSWKDGSSSIIIPSGIDKLDKMLNGGFAIDKLYTIGAAPGTGKTSMAQQIILKALEKKFGVLFISMEMERKNLFVRFLASFNSINPFRILINNIFKHETEKFDDSLKRWNNLKENYFMTEGTMSLKKIESTLKRKIKTNPIKLLVVDYIQIMEMRDSKNMSEASLIKENIRGIKELATKYHVCAIALSQITKDALGGKPGLKALKGSGGIGEDSDCVINLWTDSEDGEDKPTKAINIEVAKNRNGMKGGLVVNFDGEFNRFTENNF